MSNVRFYLYTQVLFQNINEVKWNFIRVKISPSVANELELFVMLEVINKAGVNDNIPKIITCKQPSLFRNITRTEITKMRPLKDFLRQTRLLAKIFCTKPDNSGNETVRDSGCFYIGNRQSCTREQIYTKKAIIITCLCVLLEHLITQRPPGRAPKEKN